MHHKLTLRAFQRVLKPGIQQDISVCMMGQIFLSIDREEELMIES